MCGCNKYDFTHLYVDQDRVGSIVYSTEIGILRELVYSRHEKVLSYWKVEVLIGTGNAEDVSLYISSKSGMIYLGREWKYIIDKIV